MGGRRYLTGTCVLFSHGSPPYEAGILLYGAEDIGRRPSCLQEIVSCVDLGRSTVEVEIAKDSNEHPVPTATMTLKLIDKDIWWSFPYWIAVGRLLHGSTVPVDAGFYFLAVRGQEFQVVTVNWADQEFLTENSVDGVTTTSITWHLPGLARDTSPIVNYLYETTTSKTSVKGARFEFDDRPEVEEAEKDWEEELKTQGGVVCETIFAVEPTEDTKSDPESKEKLSQEGRASSRAERAAKRKVPESGSTVKTSKDQEAGPSGTAKKGRHGVVTPVKRDSKWSLHRSLAPSRGASASDTFLTSELVEGDKLGETRAHYREASWFAHVDVLLQEEALKAAGGLPVPSPDVAGQSSAKPSESPASDNDVADPPARRVAEPAILVSTPPQSGLNLNAPIGELQADNVSMGAKNVPAERAPNSVGLPSNPAEAKAPNTEPGGQLQTPGGRPKLLKVKYHEKGKRGSPSYVVQVPRSDSIIEVKAEALQALAERDVAGESVLTAKLRWTFVDEDGSEVDISKHTTIEDLERSPAINVYVRV